MLRLMARDFLCGHGGTLAEGQFHFSTIDTFVASEVFRQRFAVEVETRVGIEVSPAQTIGQTEVDDLLHFFIRRARVRRPAESVDGLASLDTDEFVPEFSAVSVEVFRDDERAEGSVDVERGVFFIFHTYKIAQITQNARDFFTIM
jgi:hypothetical protein